MKWIWITFVVLFTNICRIYSIQTHIRRPVRFTDQIPFPSRHFRNIDSSVYGETFDWEHGLREATVQALVREHFGDGNLRKHIYSAPLLGKQDRATPFGDIAILARGQLYANYAGLIFVQDPYQNDCDDCHNIDAAGAARRRCINKHCQIWHPKSNEKLIALWSIKRIRHRSRQDSPTYEVEFSISPVGFRYQNEGYLTNEGTFNYNLPGHLFVLKSTDAHRHLEKEQNVDHLANGAFIAQTPDGRKYILHSFRGLLTPETPRHYGVPPKYPLLTSSTTQYSEEDEGKVYQTLLDLLHKKTSPEATSFTPSSKASTTLSDKTLVQFPDGQIVPITELETPFVTKTTPGYVAVRFPESNGIQTTPKEHKSPPIEVPRGHTIGITTQSMVTPQSYGILKPHTTPTTQQTTDPQGFQTTTRHMTLAEPHHTTLNKIPQTSSVVYTKPKPFYTTPNNRNYNQRPQIISTTQSATSSTTKPPYKMTFHFFAAEEEKKTTPETFTKPLTTRQQNRVTQQFTEYENFLPETLVPTEPTIGSTSKTIITEVKVPTTLKDTTKYPTVSSTQRSFTTKMVGTDYRPATVVKVTKPFKKPTTTKSYSSTLTTSQTLKTPVTSEPITKIIPSTALEPSTTYYSTLKEQRTFKAPITVLEEATIDSSLEETSKYPTTQFQQIVTVTQEPKTTYTRYKAPNESTKYTTLQFYNPTTAMTTLAYIPEQRTTLFQAPLTDIETKEPNRDTTFESTTYTKIPTLEPEKGLIETTLGVTKVMGASQNKTTDMVYYAAEETTAPIKEATVPIREPTLSTFHTRETTVPVSETTYVSVPTFRTTQPTYSILETKTTNPTTPKRIVTTIKADGTVLVKTTPISADEELFGVTKSSTKKYQATKTKTTSGPSDFLVDEGYLPDHKLSVFKKPSKDYSEDEIFGSKRTTKTSEKVGVAKHYTKSDLEQALFDTNKRMSKALFRRKSSTTESAPLVYSNFFEASTIPMPTQAHDTTTPSGTANTFVTKEIKSVSRVPYVRSSFSLSKKNIIDVTTTENVPMATTVLDDNTVANQPGNVKPVTSQSYLTSISYEVNKRKRVSEENSIENNQNLLKSTRKQKNISEMHEINENRPFNEPSYTTQMPSTFFENDFALRLVGHAKGAEYLEQADATEASTLASTSAKTTKKSKYTRRRSYVPKGKRPTRKKIERSTEI